MKGKTWITILLVILSILAFTFAWIASEEVNKKLLSGIQNEASAADEESLRESNGGNEEQEEVTHGNQSLNTDQETDMPESTSTSEKDSLDAGIPSLELLSDVVRIKAGDSFDPIAQVKEVTDDKDARDKLFADITVKGDYNTTMPGSYELKYIVRDSDGNPSAPRKLTLIVE